ncbi:MAG: hypothetical protein KAG37_01595, partial [Flavobacteriales bacterium]|nr:hypothetical protein [Flavobacteriales bacterium]
LWISTQNGLNRFDGYNFRQYYAGESNRTLQKNHIQDLYKDSFGQLWISYFRGGIDRFDTETGVFYSYRPDSSNKSSISSVDFSSTLSSDNFVRFFEDDENILWIASEKGINRFNRSTDNFTSYQFDGNNFFGLSDNIITSIVEDKYGYLWIGTYDGLNRLNKSTGTIERVITSSSNPELGAKPIISNLLPRKDGSLLVGTVNMGLFVIKNSNSEAPVHFTQYLNEFSSNKHEISIYKIIEISNGRVLFGTASGLYEFHEYEKSSVINRIDAIAESEVNNLLEDDNGYIWVSRSTTAKNKNSLYRFDKDIKDYKAFGDKKTVYYSLHDVPISKIYSNNDGIIYLGTAKHGLYKININAKRFHLINSTSSDGLYITDNDVYSIYEDSDNNLWVGTSRALDRLDLNTNKTYSFNNEKSIKHNISFEYSNTLDSKLIGVIKETKDNKLWLGSFDYKISKYDPSKKLFLNFHHNPNDSSSFTGWSTRTICITKAGVTYFGGNDMGLCKLNADGKSFTHYKEFDKNGINELTIYSLTEDKEGLIWMGTYKGLVKFNPNTEKFTSYRDNEYKLGYSITSVLEPKVHESDDVLWLGTNVGLKKFNKKTKIFELFTKEDGLPDNTVLGVLEDSDGNLWISTLNGLAKFNSITNEVNSYSLQDGIQGNEFNEGAYFMNEKGIMYFGGTNGITYFDPKEIKLSSSHGKAIITGLKINQKYVNVNDTINGEIVLTKEIPYTDEINLTYDDKIISIEFSSSNFESPYDTKYRFRLEGLEEEWNVVESNQRFANYTNLASGT